MFSPSATSSSSRSPPKTASTASAKPRSLVVRCRWFTALTTFARCIGQDATRIEHIWQDIFRGTFWRGGPVLQSALAGIDIALWDLAGKALGVPTYRLLGGKAREKVLVYRHLGGAIPVELAERAQALREEGYQVVRISPIKEKEKGAFDQTWAIRHGVDYIEALRRSDDDLEIIFEVHTRLTPARAIEFCNAIEEYRPFYVEDPIRSENPGSFATLRAHTNVALGTGEQLHTKWAFRELIEDELIDYLRVDICHSGGITEGRKIAAMAKCTTRRWPATIPAARYRRRQCCT